MILPIVHYGTPVLVKKGAPIPAVTEKIRRLAQDMLDTMYDASGIGLAAQQVGHALQLAVLDVRDCDRPSQLFMGVREIPVDSQMPMVLVNPTITRREGEEIGSEGCLSFPGLTGNIPRAATIHVQATNLDGKPFSFMAVGLLCRAIQHELDHLNGVLFIDRMVPESRQAIEAEVEELKKETCALLKNPKKQPR